MTSKATPPARDAALRAVLHAIQNSRADEAAVFDVILERAAALCHAPYAALNLVDDARENLVYVASHGPELVASKPGETRWPLTEENLLGKSILTGMAVRIDDMKDTDAYRSGRPIRVKHVDQDGIRSFMTVPLISEGRAIGSFGLIRREVDPFTQEDLELVETFATQAVIAIDNARQFRELQTRLDREEATRDILSVISQSRDDDRPVFATILDNAARLCDAAMARLLLLDEDRKHYYVAASWGDASWQWDVGIEKKVALHPELPAAQAVLGNQVVIIDDLKASAAYQNKRPVPVRLVDEHNVRRVALVPLERRGQAIGCIVVSRRENASFSPDEISLVKIFADQAVIAIDNVQQFKALETLNTELGARVTEQVDEIERMGRLKRFLPAAVADTVVSSGSEEMLKSHRSLLGVLFCDIRGFTAFCETAEPEETIEVLQTYHQEMGRLINAHGAGVDHRMGDGIMVLFNDPLPCDDPAGDAIRLALAMRARMSELSKGWKKLGHRLGFGVGVSLGYATVGMVGYEGRYDYTASGTAVNLAARLCDQAEDGEILLSPRACVAIEDTFETESRGEFDLKGIHTPVEVFRLKG